MPRDKSKIFKILPFYNSYIEKQNIKKLSNIRLLKELPFYDELSIIKKKTVFSGYAQSYKIESADKKDVIVQLKTSKISIKNLFKDLLMEMKGFKYQITLQVLLSRVKSRNLIEYSTVYLNSLTKTVIGEKYFLNECFNEIIFRLENWISHGSGWNVDNILSQYLNISSYKPLRGSTYCKLPKELSHPVKGLINIQNDANKCFLWCHVRHLNCKSKNLFRITKKDKEISKSLNYDGIEFPVSKKDYFEIEVMNKININVFSCEDKIISPVYLSDQSFNDVLDLLLLNNHYVLIKDFNRLMFNKNKCKNKKWFCKSCLRSFSNEIISNSHKKDCIIINGRQRIKLEKGFIIEFNNFNKMIPAPFKIYADFECLLKEVDKGIHNEGISFTTKYQDRIPSSFAYKLGCVDDKYSKDAVLYRGKMQFLIYLKYF